MRTFKEYLEATMNLGMLWKEAKRLMNEIDHEKDPKEKEDLTSELLYTHDEIVSRGVTKESSFGDMLTKIEPYLDLLSPNDQETNSAHPLVADKDTRAQSYGS